MSILKTCHYCGGRGYINQFEKIDGGCRAWGKECIACKGTGSILFPETNADRIRAMSDEELVEFFKEIYEAGENDAVKFEWGNIPYGFVWDEDWLQQPAEEDT